MIKIKLKSNENGYDAVSKYIFKYWKHYNYSDSVLVSLETSFDGQKYDKRNEVASPYNFSEIEFDFDWWEGEKYINILGIKYLNEINIDGEGIYE